MNNNKPKDIIYTTSKEADEIASVLTGAGNDKFGWDFEPTTRIFLSRAAGKAHCFTSLAKTSIAGGLLAQLLGQPQAEKLVLIEINAYAWDVMNDAEKRALIGHQLNHVVARYSKEGEPVLALRKHEIEAFASDSDLCRVFDPDRLRDLVTGQKALYDSEEGNTTIENFDKAAQQLNQEYAKT